MESLPKIAIFLLFFALVALAFEFFYFRRKKEKGEEGNKVSIPSKNLIIIGVVVILLVLPASLYVVSNRVNLQKEATPQGELAPATIGCTQIETTRNRIPTDSLLLGDKVNVVGYCFLDSNSRGDVIDRLRFEITDPGGQTEISEQLGFPEPQKDSGTRRFFKATQPHVKLTDAGTYTIKVSGYNSQLGRSTSFTKTVTIVSSSRFTPTPTPTPTPQVISQLPRTRLPDGQAGNNAPVCNSLSAIPLTGPAPLTVSLTGAGEDTDGTIARFEFTFGDGAKQTSRTGSVSHTYQSVGTYSASVLLRDNSGNVSAASPLCQTTITVTENPQATASSSKLRAQSDKTVTPTPTTVALPQAGINLPMLGFVGGGLLLFTLGLLLAL